MEMKKRTKIVATVGPASDDSKILEKLVLAGVDVFRLNFSHGDHASHLENIKKIKEIRKKLNRPVAILQDLSGPKIRLGKIANEPLKVSEKDTIVLDGSLTGSSDDKHIGINHKNFAQDVFEGARLLLSDGDLELEVTKVEPPKVYCRVIIGGKLYSHKGVNFPTGSFKIPALTDKDREDLVFGLNNGVDLVAMSFVRSAKDLDLARKIFEQEGVTVPLVAKIEKHEALSNLEEIVQSADGIMVARGDLGVEIDLERVPILQKQIIKMANRAGKPVITATQMLRSMVSASRPTRAEATDVANAILDGTDAVMLSEETAVGDYPVKAVLTMEKIALQAEKYYAELYKPRMERFRERQSKLTEPVSHSAVILAHDLDARMIFAVTRSGYTARAIAAYRPCSYIMALTPNENVYHQLALVWGVTPVQYPLQKNLQTVIKDATDIARDLELIEQEEAYVLTSGFPLGAPGSINQVTAGMFGD